MSLVLCSYRWCKSRLQSVHVWSSWVIVEGEVGCGTVIVSEGAVGSRSVAVVIVAYVLVVGFDTVSNAGMGSWRRNRTCVFSSSKERRKSVAAAGD